MDTGQPSDDWTILDMHDEPRAEGVYPSDCIESEDDLRRALQRRATHPGQFVLLRSPSLDLEVWAGLSASLAGVYVYTSSDPLSVQFAVPDKDYARDELSFTCEEQPKYIDAQYLMPLDRAIAVLLAIYREGKLPDWLQWKSLDG